MRGGLQSALEDRKVVLLSDPQAATAAVRKRGQTGRARTGELKEVVVEVRERKKIWDQTPSEFAWVKAHVGTQGNEKADQMAKSGAELRDEEEGMEKVVTGGGVEAGVEKEEGGGEKGKKHGDGKGGTLEPRMVGRSGDMVAGAR